MKYVWVPIALVCMLAATVLVFRLNFEEAFVVAAIGAVAWFLNYRRHVKTRLGGLEDEEKSFDQGRGVDEEQHTEDSLP
jgi:membrane protein implicated in regulation of membrane protease activity